jgi:hypothetical protein
MTSVMSGSTDQGVVAVSPLRLCCSRSGAGNAEGLFLPCALHTRLAPLVPALIHQGSNIRRDAISASQILARVTCLSQRSRGTSQARLQDPQCLRHFLSKDLELLQAFLEVPKAGS